MEEDFHQAVRDYLFEEYGIIDGWPRLQEEVLSEGGECTIFDPVFQRVMERHSDFDTRFARIV